MITIGMIIAKTQLHLNSLNLFIAEKRIIGKRAIIYTPEGRNPIDIPIKNENIQIYFIDPFRKKLINAAIAAILKDIYIDSVKMALW